MQEPTPSISETPKELPLYIKGFIIIAKILGYFLAVLFLALLLGGGMSTLAPELNPEDLQAGNISDWKSNSLINIGVLAAVLLVTWFFRTTVDRLSFQTIGLDWTNMVWKTIKGASWAIGILTIAFLILYVIGAISIKAATFNGVDLLGYLFFFLLIALVEEIIFRGYITSLIAKDFPAMVALIVGALIFAGVHVGNADFTWFGFASIFFGGYLMGVLFLKYQDLYTPIGMHWFWNYYHGNVLGFDVSGYKVASFLQIELLGADWLTGGEFGLEGSAITIALLFITSVIITKKWYPELNLKIENNTEGMPIA